MFSSEHKERNWRWRLFLSLWAIIFLLVILITAWQLDFNQSIKQWTYWLGTAAGSIAFAYPIASLWPYSSEKIKAKEYKGQITQNTNSHFAPSHFARTPRIGRIDERNHELHELRNLIEPGEVIAVVGPAGTGKSGLLCLLAEGLTKSHVVLAIRIDPHLRTIHTPEELGSHQFGDPQNPVAVLCKIRDLLGLKVCLIIDEIDGIEDTTLFGTIASIVQLAQSHSICTVVALRVEVGVGSNVLAELRRLIPGIRSIAVKPFTEELARKYLIELGVPQPSESLVKLSTNLRDLGIVATLVEKNADIPSEPNRRELWDAYINEMDQKENGGQGHVTGKAISLAKQMLETGSLAVPFDNDSYTRKIVSWGACVHFSATDRIEFRYEELVYFLYAREAVSYRKTLQDIQCEVDERFLSKVLTPIQQHAFEVDTNYGLQLAEEIQQ